MWDLLELRIGLIKVIQIVNVEDYLIYLDLYVIEIEMSEIKLICTIM